MTWLENRWAWGAGAVMLLLPAALVSQTPAPQSPPNAPSTTQPVQQEVKSLTLKGVKAVDAKDLRLSISTDQSHCASFILAPICLISKTKYFYVRKYLDHNELSRDVLRTRVYYWKRGYRETQVDTTVTKTDEDDVAVTFLITEGDPTIVSDVTVTQKQNVLTDREVTKRIVL